MWPVEGEMQEQWVFHSQVAPSTPWEDLVLTDILQSPSRVAEYQNTRAFFLFKTSQR